MSRESGSLLDVNLNGSDPRRCATLSFKSIVKPTGHLLLHGRRKSSSNHTFTARLDVFLPFSERGDWQGILPRPEKPKSSGITSIQLWHLLKLVNSHFILNSKTSNSDEVPTFQGKCLQLKTALA